MPVWTFRLYPGYFWALLPSIVIKVEEVRSHNSWPNFYLTALILAGMGKIKKGWTLMITKFKEWITAVKLEKQYTKQEILAMYLNKFNFIYGAYGISAASEIYFGKNQKELHIEEAATLIGMLKNPALFNPVRGRIP